jgi:uncharacterized protein YjiS (DUF1127 family)
MLHCNNQSVLRSRRLRAPQEKEFPMFVSWILSKVRAYMNYRETVRELSQLTDRELDDLGISRFEIDGIARTHSGV